MACGDLSEGGVATKKEDAEVTSMLQSLNALTTRAWPSFEVWKAGWELHSGMRLENEVAAPFDATVCPPCKIEKLQRLFLAAAFHVFPRRCPPSVEKSCC